MDESNTSQGNILALYQKISMLNLQVQRLLLMACMKKENLPELNEIGSGMVATLNRLESQLIFMDDHNITVKEWWSDHWQSLFNITHPEAA